MSLIYFIMPFAISTIIISSGAIALRVKINKQNKKNSTTSISSVCANLHITSKGLAYVNNINSIPNDPFRDDKSITGLEFLCKQESIADDNKIENTIISTLVDKI